MSFKIAYRERPLGCKCHEQMSRTGPSAPKTFHVDSHGGSHLTAHGSPRSFFTGVKDVKESRRLVVAAAPNVVRIVSIRPWAMSRTGPVSPDRANAANPLTPACTVTRSTMPLSSRWETSAQRRVSSVDSDVSVLVVATVVALCLS